MSGTIEIEDVILVKISQDVKKDDIVTFEDEGEIITHRIIKETDKGIVTKGDANNGEDMNDVPYEDLIGIVVKHIPIMGQLLILFGSTFGRICMICFAACGALLNILGSRFRDALMYEREEELERERLLAEAMKTKKD